MSVQFRKGIDLNAQQAKNAADGSAATDLVTLQQMQAAIRGLDWKPSVRAKSTGNITVSSPGASIDGVSLSSGDSVLLASQTTASENGIWVWNGAAVPMTRRNDADADAEVTGGLAVTVTEGTVGADTMWVLTTNDAIVVGTTGLAFAQLGGGSTPYTAGNGLLLTSQSFSVKIPGSSGLIVDGTGVYIDTSVVSRVYQADCVVTTNPQTFTHGLGKRPNVTIIRLSDGAVIYPDVTISTTTIVVDWGAAPSAAEYRVLANG